MTNQKKVYGLAIITILLWSTGNTVIALLLGQNSMSNAELVFYMSLCATIVLVVVCALTGRLKQLKALRAIDLAGLFGLGLLGYWLYYMLLYYGMGHLKAQQASTLNYLWPMLIVLFSALINKEKLTARKLIALFISFFGVAVIATEGNFLNLAGVNVLGVVTSAGAACAYALFAVLNMRIKSDTVLAMMIYVATSTVACAINLLVTGTHLTIPTMGEGVGLMYMGGLLGGGAYVFWLYVLEHGDTAKVSNLAYLNPIFSLVCIWLVLGERIEVSSYVGLVFIMLGIGLQMLPEKRTAASRASERVAG